MPRTTNDGLFSATARARAAKFAERVGKTCSLCPSGAIFRVGAKGYCRAHKAQAEAHARLTARARQID